MFGSYTKYHFTGIGGIGMSGLAELLIAKGCYVSGSDRQLNQQTERLQQLGARISEGHSEEAVGDAEVLVYTAAVSEDNPELLAAREKDILTIKRSDLLAEMLRMKKGICVAGVHGKTTTTSMIGLIFEKAGVDPSVIVGGNLREFNGSNVRVGNSDIVIAESDEYDRTFLRLYPYISVITSIELEHVDIYLDLEDIKNAFITFANKTPFYNRVILCADDEGARSVIPELNRRVYTYGLSDEADLQAQNIMQNNLQSKFTVYEKGHLLGTVNMKIPGMYNVQNALAAIAVAKEMDIPFEYCREALETFRGVQRRFEIKFNDEITVIDDYAHHPGETSALIKALKESTDKRIIAVFQPHLYSRTRDFYEAFADSFLPVDVMIGTDVYPAREKPIEGINGKLITDTMRSLGHNDVTYIENKADIHDHLVRMYKEKDIIVTIGAGDIWKEGEKFIDMIRSARRVG